MALIVEAVGRAGVVERITVEGGAATVNAQPGLTYRILDGAGRELNASATVRRVGDHLIIEGLPDETTVQLTDFFFVCTPNDPCSLDLEGLGGTRGETISQVTEPVAALADGSFVLHAPASMATPTAPESEFSAKPALAGLALLALAGGGGGGGGGDSGPTPPPPGSTTVTSPPVTNDTTPVIAGTAVAGAQITVTLDIPGSGPVTFHTVADGNGNWSVDTDTATPATGTMPTAGLPPDAPTTVRILTAGSNEPITYQLSTDFVPPDAPVIAAVTGDDLINADEARDANPSPITVEGTAEAGSTVVVSWHGEDQVATTGADRNWAVTFNGQEIPDGAYTISAVATDLAGNTGSAGTRPVTVVTGRPSAPIIEDVAGDNIINIDESNSGITIRGSTTADTDVFVSFGGIIVDRQATIGGDGTSWTVTVDSTQLAQLQEGGSYQVTAYATDGVNRSIVGTSEAVVVDRTAPGAPSINVPVEGDNIVNAAEAADGVTVIGTAEAGSTVQVNWGGSPHAPITADQNGVWTAVFANGQVPADGSHAVTVVAIDAAGNTSTPTVSPAVTVDRTLPGLTITNSSIGATNEPVTFTFTFGEPVTGFTAGDIDVVNGTPGALIPVTATTYTMVVTPVASGSMTVNVAAGVVTDLAGNGNTAGTGATSVVVDVTSPTPTITDDNAGIATGPVTFTFDFGEAVTDFAAIDIDVTGGTKGAFTAVGTGVYTLVVTPVPDVEGIITVNVPPGAATDLAGNPSLAAPPPDQPPYTQPYDTRIPPTPVIADDTPGIATGPVTFTFDFGEAVTGFTEIDIDVTGGTKGVFTPVSASEYELVVNPTASSVGTITVNVDANVANDLAGNPNLEADQATQDYDTRTIAITDLFDDVGIDTGPVPNGGSADDNAPTITVTLSGVLQAGESIVLVGGVAPVATSPGGDEWQDSGLVIGTPYSYTARVMSGADVIHESAPWGYTFSFI